MKKKVIIIILELAVIVAMLVALYMFRDFGKTSIPRVEFADDDIEINEPVKEDEEMKGYLNIALFGVDSRGGRIKEKTRSDVMIIASINQDTGDIKLVSVYRDTYLNLSTDKYQKCNAAYMYGGPKQTINMLNQNLDLDIKDFVTVGFEGLRDAVDALGGIMVDVSKSEIVHLNNYQFTMAEDLDCDYTPVKEEGYQLLDGLQATAYCRIRYTSGGDFKRAERQREVIKAMIDKAKQCDVETLVKVVNEVAESGVVYTSLDIQEMLALVPDLAKYKVVEEGGFPNADYRSTGKLGSDGDCVLALDLVKNVEWLHEFLFDDAHHEVSDTVKTNSQYIRERIAKYLPNMKYPE